MRNPNQVTLLRLALQQRPDSHRLHHQLGSTLLEEDLFEEAENCFRQALALEPGSLDALHGLAETHWRNGSRHARAGRSGEAIASLHAALDVNPEHYNALHLLARLLIAADEPREALRACDRSLERVPGNTAALATRSVVLLECGERAAAAELLNFDRFVSVVKPSVPADAGDAATFLARLEQAIRTDPALQFEPRGRTARGGSRADLVPAGDAPAAVIHGMMDDAARRYRDELDDGPPHPFVAKQPRQATLTLWSNVLQSGGFHTAHIHPAAWLSGVFYVKVPAGGIDAAGALELGCDSHVLRRNVEPMLMRVCPEPGSLVLFPSYFYHRTLPTRGAGERISIAFDLVSDR